jgi:hypothetical protein
MITEAHKRFAALYYIGNERVPSEEANISSIIIMVAERSSLRYVSF